MEQKLTKNGKPRIRKPGAGRPKKENKIYFQITMGLDEEINSKIKDLAKNSNTSTASVARNLIKKGLNYIKD